MNSTSIIVGIVFLAIVGVAVYFATQKGNTPSTSLSNAQSNLVGMKCNPKCPCGCSGEGGYFHCARCNLNTTVNDTVAPVYWGMNPSGQCLCPCRVLGPNCKPLAQWNGVSKCSSAFECFGN